MDIKKKIIYSVATIIILIIFTTITVLALGLMNGKSNDNEQNQQDTNQTIESKELEAAQKLNTDTAKAKELLLEARAEYEKLGDDISISNIDAQLYYIENTLEK